MHSVRRRRSCCGNCGTRGLATAGPIVVCLLAVVGSTQTYALNGDSHQRITKRALAIVEKTDADAWEGYCGCEGQCAALPRAPGAARPSDPAYSTIPWNARLITEAEYVDEYRDLEFVDVEGVGEGRDDPHRHDPFYRAIDDRPHYTEEGYCLTACNHFIDIRKGRGLFDDYDGYSYARGSGRRGQYQDASDAATGFWAKLLAKVTGFKVDEGLFGYWFNDEYIHAPCHRWYRDCSPSVERYSFPEDRGAYDSVKTELAGRFPLAASTGSPGRGIPYSVFMPVDNMARYWYGRFAETRDPQTLGPVLHAIQDASVPHHAAGCSGNWHGRYEAEVEARLPGWLNAPDFDRGVDGLLATWDQEDAGPPDELAEADHTRRPAANWRVDQLVTWVALNAYREYDTTLNGYRGGWRFDEASAQRLSQIACAMGVLVLRKAATDGGIRGTDADVGPRGGTG